MRKQWIALGWLVGLVLFSVSARTEVIDNVPTLSGSITIDGELNEPLWQQAKKISINNITIYHENPKNKLIRVGLRDDCINLPIRKAEEPF